MGCIVKANSIHVNTLPVACRWATPRRRVPTAPPTRRRTEPAPRRGGLLWGQATLTAVLNAMYGAYTR